MGDQYGGRGRGRGQGRGRGRGGRGGQAQTIKNLERAANDIQNVLQKMTTSDDQDTGGGMGGNRRKGNRGCKSLMDLNVDTSPPWSGPPRQDHHYQRPDSQGSYHHGPPHQDPYYRGPPNQGPYYPGPPNQGPGYHGPPGQSYHGPPGQGYHGPPGQGPYPRGQYNEGPPNQYPPPPSYDESVAHYGGRQQSPAPQKKSQGGKAYDKGKGKSVSAEELVKALALFEGQMADTQMISKQIESSVEDVEKVVKQRKDIFAHMKDGSRTVVELVPNIKLCSYYLSESGCTARDTCKALHLCKNFVMARCDKGPSCSFGHKVDTNHNAAILSKMYLDLIKTNNLLSVIRKVCRGNAPPRICSYYETKAGCRKKDDCRFLHICKDYVMNGGNCSVKGCSLNHQLTNKQCRNVLTQHGISTNESIRDILVNLKSSYQSSGGPGEGTRDKKKAESDESEDSSDSDTSHTSAEASVKRKKKRDRSHDKTKGKNPTIRSTDFNGDVEIPEICIYAVSNKCTNEKKGCKYLHAKSLFHWQVGKANKWYNFRIFQSKALESAYRDVSKAGTKLPSLDADKLSPEDKRILGLLGTCSWTANFKEMCITDPANNTLNIRRVSTPSSASSPLPQATVYEWYFTDEQGKWIRYGHVDSLGKQDLVCIITSEDIEKQYVTDSSATMIISNNRFKYKIDFTNMTQTNLSSMKVREIRRRPSRLSYQKGGTGTSTSESDGSLPAHWKPMSPQQTHILVTLDPSQAEYQEVSKSIKLMIPTAKIREVRRLQNEYLWRLYQYKKDDLSRRYDDDTMNVQKLFHGTTSESINPICKENIDGRRYANTKDKYGKGTYFSNSPAIARTYCTPDGQGHLFLILAEVIIGYVTVGNKNMNRPPPNVSTGYGFDTTVDSMTAPTVFVKYDKEEYYPEYIVEISA